MANNIKPRTWVLDTAATTTDLWSGGPVFIAQMIWQPSAGSQSLIVKDRAANVIWSTTSSAATPTGDQTWTNQFPEIGYNGFILHTMTAGGTLYVQTV